MVDSVVAWRYNRHIDSNKERTMKTDQARKAVIQLLKSQLATQREDIVKAAFFNVFKDIDQRLARVLWLEAQV